MFSLNFSLAGKGPFIAVKAKKICARGALSWEEGGSGVHGKFRSYSKFSETSFPHFKTLLILCKSAVVTFTQFKTIDSNDFTLSSMFSFQNAWPINRRKAVYT